MGLPVHLHMLCSGPRRLILLLLLAASIRAYVYNGTYTVVTRNYTACNMVTLKVLQKAWQVIGSCCEFAVKSPNQFVDGVLR